MFHNVNLAKPSPTMAFLQSPLPTMVYIQKAPSLSAELYNCAYTCTAPLHHCVCQYTHCIGLSRLGLSRLVSTYFLSQNTIHSTSPILFMRSAEQGASAVRTQNPPARRACSRLRTAAATGDRSAPALMADRALASFGRRKAKAGSEEIDEPDPH